MRTARPLPESLALHFSIAEARAAGASRGRLHRPDLEIPFRGTRTRPQEYDLDSLDPYERQAAERRIRAREYAPLLKPDQFYSHDTAVALRGGPLPLVTKNGFAVDGRTLDVHVSTFGSGPLARASGVRGHRANPDCARVIQKEHYRLSAPATNFAQLGDWDLFDAVAFGDHLCRVWRDGVGRPDAGCKPISTTAILRAMISKTRWRGIRMLPEAVELIREDSWSPRETRLRLLIVEAGLPEPFLNHDVFDELGRFLGCVDLAYPEHKIAIEYQSVLHHSRYSADVERLAALRAAGWTVIEVTSELLARPSELIARISRALTR